MQNRNRIGEALSIRGMKSIELSEKTGIDQGSISSWKAQRWQPKQDSLHKMAKVLEVSEMWLAGFDVPMERPLEQQKMDSLTETIHILKTNERYFKLTELIVKLDENQLVIVENMVNEFSKINRLH